MLLWSHRYSRLMLPEGKLEAMGYPAVEPDRALGLSLPWG